MEPPHQHGRIRLHPRKRNHNFLITQSLHASRPLLRDEWGKKGVYMTPADRSTGTTLANWVGMGINILNEKIKISPIDQKPQLFFFKNCDNTIREFQSYRWKEERKPALYNSGRPEKADDHCMDALRYFAVAFKGRRRIEFPDDDKDWSFV